MSVTPQEPAGTGRTLIERVNEYLGFRLKAKAQGLEGAVLGYDRQLAKYVPDLITAVEAAYQRGRLAGREEAAKVCEEWKAHAGQQGTRCVLEVLADHIRRSLPQEGG